MAWKHGASGYTNYGCRCEECRAGWAAWKRAYMQRRKARTGERVLHGRFVPASPKSQVPGA